MAEPDIPAKNPAVQEMEAGSYHWCSCGKSQKQPLCDGSHKGTEFTPMAFTVEEKKTFALCQCKRTGNPPFCDGSHSKL